MWKGKTTDAFLKHSIVGDLDESSSSFFLIFSEIDLM